MKKVKICLIIGVAFVFLFAGCARKKAKEKKGVVTIRWVADPNPIRLKQIALFEKSNPDIKVNLDWSSAGLQKILTQIAGGNAPDVIILFSASDISIFAEKGALSDLTPYCEKYNVPLDDFWPLLKPYMYYEGKVYALCDNATPYVLYYNKKLFDSAGIPYPTDKWTWEDLLSASKALTKEIGPRVKQFGFLTGVRKEPFYWQNGASFYSKDKKRCIINSKEGKEALRFLYDMQFKYHLSPSPSEMQSIGGGQGWGSGLSLFMSGKIGMYPCGRWVTINYRKIKDFEWDIAPLPKGKYKATLFLSHSWAIPEDSNHKEEAFRFVKFLSEKDNELLVTSTGDGVPSRISISKTKEFLFNPEFPKETKNQLYLDEMKYAHNYELAPYAPAMEVNRIYWEEYDKMDNQIQTPEETLDRIAQRINKLIGEELKD